MGKGGTANPLRRNLMTSATYFHGDTLRLSQVSMTLAIEVKAKVPSGVRVPKLIRLEITQCRSARSASLLVNGNDGYSSIRQIASQS